MLTYVHCVLRTERYGTGRASMYVFIRGIMGRPSRGNHLAPSEVRRVRQLTSGNAHYGKYR